MSRTLTRSFLCTAIAGAAFLNSIPVIASELPTVVVSAARTEQSSLVTPASISVITREQIVDSGASTVSEVLRGRGGVQLSDLFGDGSNVSIGMRGFAENSNSNTLVMVDGRRLNYSDTRSPDLGYVSLHDVERIEIVKGSAGVLFGDQAVGGVINIITRQADQASSRLELQAGSYDRKGAAVHHSNRLDNGLNYRFSASGYDTDNYRDHNEHSNVNVNAYGGYDYASGSVFVEVQKVEDDLQTPGALIQSELDANRRQINSGFVNDFANTDVDVQRVGIKQGLSDRWSLEAEVTNREIDQDVRQSFRDYPAPESGYSERDLLSVNPRLIGAFDSSQGDVLVTLGVDAENAEYALYLPYDSAFGTGFAQQHNEQDVVSIYAQLVYPLSEKLSITAGMRRAELESDISDSSSYNFSPLEVSVDDSVNVAEIGLRYQISESGELLVRRDENYRFAKINEYALAPVGEPLETQQGVSWEIAYRARVDKTRYEIQLYRMELENEFFYDPSVGDWGANVNLDETIHEGLILDYQRELGDAAYVGLSYTYTDAYFNSGGLDGNSISGVADNQFSIRTGYDWNARWSLFAELLARSDMYAQGDNLNALDKVNGYGLLNASIAYATKTYDVSLRINNLLDKEYSEFITDNGFQRAFQPSPERNFMVTAGMKF
jgi:iron complex outermembrane receptor protein